jgi:hypothetical protein
MGGRALAQHGIETRRYTTPELEQASQEIQKKLSDLYPGIITSGTRYYDTKQDHGDLDLLVFPMDLPEFGNGIRKVLEEEFGAQKVIHNDIVWTFDYNDLQVDLIVLDQMYEEMAKMWYGYNDLSTLIGRVYRFWHLKWSPQGVFYTVYADDRSRILGELRVTRDPRGALELLGYDYDRYLQSFSTLEDVFEYLVSGERFSAECCDPKYLSNDTRIRDAKRTNVQLFDEWMKKKEGCQYFPRPTHLDTIKLIDKDFNYLLGHYFPDFSIADQIMPLYQKHAMKKMVSAKFNGGYVREAFGIDGRELGEALKKFKLKFRDQDEYDFFVLANTLGEILNYFEKNVVNAPG